MCPLWPFHIIILYLLALCPLWFAACHVIGKVPKWMVKFSPSEIQSLAMNQIQQIHFTVSDLTDADIKNGIIKLYVDDLNIANNIQPSEFVLNSQGIKPPSWTSSFNISGNFLGYTSAKLQLFNQKGKEGVLKKESDQLPITVVRKQTIMDRIFTGSVIVLVSVIFINFGCALDVHLLKEAILKPIGPAIGLFNHYLFLPLVSYGMGELLFPNSTPMKLGFFFTGVSPAGGASNIWTYSLGGNLSLSITMTAVSTLVSFGMIPLWAFTLGRVIFSDGKLGVPYSKIGTSAIGLIVPLAIGYLIQIYCKRLSKVMVRILKPFSALLIVFIVIFAIVTNLYLFKLFTWQIIVGGMCLPWIGYLCGWILATIFRQKPEDRLAIAIETGVQNTGIAIFMLKFCLPQPAADLTTVAPVAVALMTPLPLLAFSLVQRFWGRTYSKPLSEDNRLCISPSSDKC